MVIHTLLFFLFVIKRLKELKDGLRPHYSTAATPVQLHWGLRFLKREDYLKKELSSFNKFTTIYYLSEPWELNIN